MKKIILSIIFLAFFGSVFSQGVVPVNPTTPGKLPHLDILQLYKPGNDSSLMELYQDTVKFRTNQAAYSFNKELYVKGINIAEGGSIVINNDTVLSLDTTNIVYKSTTDTITGNKTFSNGLIVSGGDISSIPNLLNWLLYDNQTSALSFDATGRTGLLKLITTNGAEKVEINGEVDIISTLNSVYGTYNYLTGTYCIGNFNYTTGANSNAIENTAEGYQAMAGAFYTYGIEGTGQYTKTNSYRAIPGIFESTLCDTILQLDKGATNILKVTNSADSCKLLTGKTVFALNKRIYSPGFTVTGLVNGVVSNTYGNSIISSTLYDDAIAYQGTTDGDGATVALFTSNGVGAVPVIGTATTCDTILQLNKSATNVLNIANATSSVKLNSEKDLFEFNKHIATVEVTKAYQTLTYNASVTMNTNIGANAKITLTGNCAMTLSNLTNGDEGNIIVIQDATGSRTIIISPTPKVINGGSGAVTLSTAANSIDIISYTYDGTNLYVNYGKNYN